VLALGATPEDIAAAPSLPALALNFNLRLQRPLTLGQAVADAGMEWPTAQRMVSAMGLPADPAQT
jgi:hypothetical protein